MSDEWKKPRGPWARGSGTFSGGSGPWTVENAHFEGNNEPFPFTPSPPKIYYDEGDITTSAYSPLFRVLPEGETDRELHKPCGYWARIASEILTSRPYALEDISEVKSLGGIIIEGVFRLALQAYELTESSQSLGGSVESGILRATLISLNLDPESAVSLGGSLLEGVFRATVISYGPIYEEVVSLGGSAESGIFKRGLISYTYWPHEDVKSNGGQVLEGNHATT